MFVLTVVLCLAGASAVPANQQRIVGGSVTTIEQYPTIVALLYSWSGIAFFNQACGGTILNRRSLITAAHCPHGDSASKWRIRVGSTWANRGGTVFGVQSVITHPNYNTQTLDSDIAIMCISGSMTTSSFVQPASIAGPEHIVPDNQVVWAAGWGTVSYGGLPSEQLQHVQIWTVNQAICAERYAAVGAKITANMLCSGWLDVGGRDQCQGDSGSPLYLNNVVVGVCSWGWGCANHFFPGVNTRVSRFNTWIMANACTEN